MHLPDLIPARLIKRYKRFLADVTLEDGSVITAHCPNTGAMTGCAEPGSQVWLSISDNPKRKYAHTWELVETPQGVVSVNTGRANGLVAEVLARAQTGEGVLGGLLGVDDIQPEARIPEGNGRFDFKVLTEGAPTWIEVKSVTLHVGGRTGAFPDAVSERALKHVIALRERVSSGERAMLVFCAQHCGLEQVRLASEIDSAYATAVSQAHEAGVQVVALGCKTDLVTFVVDRLLPVDLSPGNPFP